MKVNQQHQHFHLMNKLVFYEQYFIFILLQKGFLCPICHHKFNDQTELAEHYIQTHAQEPVIENDKTNGVQNLPKQEITEVNKNN